MALFSFTSSLREQGEARANSLDTNTIFTLIGRNQCWRLGREVKIKSVSPLQRTELRVVSCLQGSATLCDITSSQIMACSCTFLPIWLICSQSQTKNHWKANFPLHRQQNFLVLHLWPQCQNTLGMQFIPVPWTGTSGHYYGSFYPPSNFHPASGQLYPKFKRHLSLQHTSDVEILILLSPEQWQWQLTVLMVWTLGSFGWV